MIEPKYQVNRIEFQIGDRKTGKTTLLLEWMKEAPEGERRVMVCATQAMADVAYKRSKEMGLGFDRKQFTSYETIRRGYLRGWKDVVLGIDNIELMLSRLFDGYPVGRVTATGKDVLRDPD